MNKATGGRITIQVFAGGQLGNERDMYEGAQMGTIDMFTASNAVLTSFIPEMAVLDQPFLFETADEAHRVIDGTVGTLIAEKTEEQKKYIQWVDGWRFPQYLLHPSGHIPGRYEKS
ncbi:MAG: TRAP transporter substrate-binding protein DctP [Enterocloster sp.]